MAILSLDKNKFAFGKNQPDFQRTGAEILLGFQENVLSRVGWGEDLSSEGIALQQRGNILSKLLD